MFRLFNADDEGELSRKLVHFVCRETLVLIAKAIHLGNFMILSDSEASTGGRVKSSNLENVLEAIIAAIFIDGGFPAAKSFVEKHWAHLCIENLDAPKNPKNILQEITQNRKISSPLYELLEKIGPDHNPMFRVKVKVLGYGEAVGQGKTLKIAEQCAAELLVKLMQKVVVNNL